MHSAHRLPLGGVRSTSKFTVCAVAFILSLVRVSAVYAIEELVTEADIADLLIQPARHHAESEQAEKREWAILPQLGYGPDTGPVVGVKFTHRDVFDTGMTFDVDATYAVLNQQQSSGVKLMQPHLADDRFLFTIYGKYRFDPQREFFGLGNNDRGPAPASTHAYQDYFGVLAFGWRPMPRLALNFSVALRQVDIRRGHRRTDCAGFVPCPFTLEEFPNMPGVQSGSTNPLSVSLVYNGRDNIVRPTQGWRLLLKASHTNKALLSDFEFTRVVGDVGYLQPFFDRRLVTGLRVDGEWMDGPSGRVPFWELPDLGGSDSLRGFFPHRFVGKKRLLVNLELRGLLTEFDFYSLWHVKLDGVVFGETGRVFIDRSDVANEFHAARPDIHLVSHLQYSYGGGLRIELSEALVARLDLGFSDEEKGLFYFTFGQTF